MKSARTLCMTLITVCATLAIPSLLAQNNRAAGVPPLTLKFRTIDIPTDQSTQVYAINNKNEGAGIYFDSTGLQHGMLIHGSTVTKIDDPFAKPGTTVCFGINDNHVVVGSYTNATGFEVGFEYRDHKYRDVQPFVSPDVQIYGINNSGVVTGTYYDTSAGVWNAFYGSGNNFTSFTVPGGGYYVYGSNINNAGLIVVGYFVDPANPVYMADLYNPTTGVFTPINFHGAAQTQVNGINDKNDVVYTWFDMLGKKHGGLLVNGTFITFDDPAGTDTAGDGINNNDVVVGTFLPTGDTQRQSFAATRQP